MKIIGFNLTKISVQREEKPKEKIKIKSNVDIKDVSKDIIEITIFLHYESGC